MCSYAYPIRMRNHLSVGSHHHGRTIFSFVSLKLIIVDGRFVVGTFVSNRSQSLYYST